MRLKSLTIQGYGPFALSTTIDIDPNVTVLTGANDVGKSSVLQVIEHFCSGAAIDVDAVNVDRIYDSKLPWNKDPEIYAIGTVIVPSNSGYYFVGQHVQPKDEVEIAVILSRGSHHRVTSIKRNNQSVSIDNGALNRLPKVLRLSDEEFLSSILDVENLNPLENSLLILAFGENPVGKLNELPEVLKVREIQAANRRINKRLHRLIPEALGIEFILSLLSENPLKFSISIQDRYASHTPVTFRGKGIRKIASLMLALSSIDRLDEYLYILIDEPENSLHADAQHLFRTLLEEIAQSPQIQVIYATHSPSMINPVKCEGLRLLERKNVGGRATTVVNNNPFDGTFYPVRMSLGISPADSLLYAPITIITEGVTELRSIPLVLQRLYHDGGNNYESLGKILPLIHFVDGQGDNFERWCRLSMSQGAKPIIFVDGDKIRRVRQQKVKEKLQDVPIIHLKDGEEFENLVPQEIYFNALSECIGLELSLDMYNSWLQNANLPSHLMFTKCVERWLQDAYPEAIYEKPSVMRLALEKAELSQINLEPFKKLILAIEELLGLE